MKITSLTPLHVYYTHHTGNQKSKKTKTKQKLLEYTITGGDGESLFQIDSASGAITTKSGTVLDYEVKSQYTVAVTATDPDGEASTANTVIDIVDLNEAPVLPATVAFAVRRTPEIGTTIDTIEATDEDRPADPLTYSIVSPPVRGV